MALFFKLVPKLLFGNAFKLVPKLLFGNACFETLFRVQGGNQTVHTSLVARFLRRIE